MRHRGAAQKLLVLLLSMAFCAAVQSNATEALCPLLYKVLFSVRHWSHEATNIHITSMGAYLFKRACMHHLVQENPE